ncbi:hypothetical protein LRP52_32740 [Photobacterium sp. ZSDE20]|uniref:Polysaccharide biosynthesis protein C-terminal domain-containing protein n=1 Tax=Photobacterium pectinilyticum TaxID=2906793 RepID=A0ABT1N9R5_9GAMM|nr:hypothetical protein [Photobacterium sp. ZSDE20]MCQ1060024.1 hypothetical protein [Photobacterium sp. ZSDE20]MDD1826953.1 hypothetical protein [Photobacterium sp. ZSDE20]
MKTNLISIFFNTFIYRAFTIFFLFINGVLLARVLGPEVLGIYVFSISLKRLFSVFLSFGTGIGLTYFSSKVEDRKINLKSFLIISLTFSILPTFAILCSYKFLSVNEFQLFLIALSTFCFCLSEFNLKVARGVGGYKIVNLLELFSSFLFFVLISPLLFVDLPVNLLSIILIALLSSEVFVLIFGFHKTRKFYSLPSGFVFSFGKLINYSRWNYLSNAINMSVNELPVIIYRYLGFSTEFISYLSRSQSLLNLPRGFFIPISQNLFHSFSNGSVKKSKAYMIIILSFCFSTLISIIIYCLSDLLIMNIYGHEYIYAAIYVRLLSVGMAFLPVTLLVVTWLSARGQPRITTFVSIINLLLFVSLTFIYYLVGYEDLSVVLALSTQQVITSVLYFIIFIRFNDT